jgi:hypothetical protein
LAPSLLLRVLQAADALLPRPGGIQTAKARGVESRSGITESPLTVLNKKAEREYNQQ